MAVQLAQERQLEADEKKILREWLSKRGCFHFWPVQEGYGQAALDCYCCDNGMFIGIEVKKKGWTPSHFTKRQLIIMQEIWDKGGCVAHGCAGEIIEQIEFRRWYPMPRPQRRPDNDAG